MSIEYTEPDVRTLIQTEKAKKLPDLNFCGIAFSLLVSVFVGIAYVSNAKAGLYDDDNYTTLASQNANFYSELFHQNFLNNLVDPLRNNGNNTGSGNNPTSGSSKPNSTVISAPNKRATGTIAKLVSAYPPSARPLAKKLFNQLYSSYHKIEKYYGIPKYDLAGAVAAFIVANYMAYKDVDVSDNDYKVVVEQIRQALRNNRGFTKLKPMKKRMLYEKFAIIGTFVATTRLALQQQPQHEISLKLQDAARLYLEQLLKINADSLQITPNGIAII